MKKTLKLIVIAAISTLLCNACGGSSSTPNNATESSLNATKTTTTNTTNNDNAKADATSQTNTVAELDTIPEPEINVAKTSFMDKARQFTPETVELPKAETYLADANKKDADAQYVLSLMYRTNTGDIDHIVKGKKTRHNANKPYEMYRWSLKASSNSELPRYIENPSFHLSDDDVFNMPKTLNWLNLASSAGIPDAEFILGMLHYRGVAVVKDTDKGLELIARAALHGLPAAQYFIGMCYELGIGTDVDKTEALSWLEKATNAGNLDAAFILSLKYLDGIDVAKDEQKSKANREQSEKYHAWSLLLNPQYTANFENVCKNNYDEVEMDSQYADDCGGDYDGWDPELSDAENEKRIFENNAIERTNSSLPYSINYALAWNWLVRLVNTNKYFHANLLYAQLLASSGCHAQDDTDYSARSAKAEKRLNALYSLPNADTAMADYANASFIHYNGIDTSVNDDAPRDNLNALARKTFNLYKSAANKGYKPAFCELARVYDEYDPPSLLQYDIPEVEPTNHEEIALDLYIKCGDNRSAADKLSMKADTIFKTDPQKSVPLYEQAAEHGDKDSMYKLAQMYHNGKYVTQNDNKSLKYYQKCIENPNDYYRYTGFCALDLSQVYAKTDAEKSATMCQLAYHIFFTAAEGEDTKQKLGACAYKIELLPRIEDLQTELENEIALEKGKKLSEFFAYTSIIKPCKKSNTECESIVPKYYKESIPKAIRGITALVIGQKGRVDLNLIKNTYYYLAIYLGKNEKYITRFDETSPIPGAIKELDTYNTRENMIFFTWYLRQIPYAAKDVYNKNPGSKSWDDLLKEADKAISNSEELKTAFGFDPMIYEL